MKRTQIYLEEEQDRQLSARASATGETKSTIIRRAIDAFLQGPPDRDVRMSRFRSALDELADHPIALPDGRAYVEAMRALDVARHDELERRRG